jgi:RimJ/RimL family protein N-acetyltransferase
VVRVVRTSRLVLRCWRVADGPRLSAAIEENLEHLRPWIAWARREPLEPPARRAQLAALRRRFLAGRDFAYSVWDHQEERLLGGAGLHPRVGAGGLEIGYWIGAAHGGAGLGAEAAGALTRVALERMGARFVEIQCDPANVRSARIAERLGYRRAAVIEGRMRHPHDGIRDTMVWRMEARELAASAAAALPVDAAVVA